MLEKDALETYHVGYQQISASWQPHVFGEVFYLVKKKKRNFLLHKHTHIITHIQKEVWLFRKNELSAQAVSNKTPEE